MNKSILSIYALLGSLTVTACSSNPALTVTGKEYVYPRFSSAWLEPCVVPSAAGVETEEGLALFIKDLIGAIKECDAKIGAIKKTNDAFIQGLSK